MTSGAFVLLLGTAIARLGTLVLAILLARVLGQEEYGAYGLLLTTVTTASVIFDFGFGMTAAQRVATMRDRDPERLGSSLRFILVGAAVSGGFVALAAALTAGPVSRAVFERPDLTSALRIAALILPALVLSGVLSGALASFERFATVARGMVLASCSSLILAPVGAHFLGLRGGLGGFAVGAWLAVLLLASGLARTCAAANIRLQRGRYREAFNTIGSFSLPSMLANGVLVAANWLGALMIVRTAEGYAEVALLNAGIVLQAYVLFIPSSLAPLFLARIGRSHSHSGGASFGSEFRIALVLNVGAAILASCVIVLAAPWLLAVFGASFVRGVRVVRWLAVAAVLSAYCAVLGLVLASMARMWLGLALNLLWATIFLGAALKLVPAYGATGLAQAQTVAFVLHVVASSICVAGVRRTAAVGVGERASAPGADR